MLASHERKILDTKVNEDLNDNLVTFSLSRGNLRVAEVIIHCRNLDSLGV